MFETKPQVVEEMKKILGEAELSPKRSATAQEHLREMIGMVEHLRFPNWLQGKPGGNWDDVVALAKEAGAKDVDYVTKEMDDLQYEILQFNEKATRLQESILKKLDEIQDRIRKKFGSIRPW